MKEIPFNKPYLTGKEVHYLYQSVYSGKISGNGKYTKLCQEFFETAYSIKKALMTTSCTDALEMCALLLDIKEGDEIIAPSYTFVSTVLPFIRQGANIVFADSLPDHPNIDESKVEELITDKTKAIVVVHYAGVACNMKKILNIAQKHNVRVVEDAAQSIDSFYNGKPLGSLGDLATFSFHETKNIISGEGGLLAINNPIFINRSELIWEKGTNRASFFRGEINKYGWVDTGSSFLPSEIISAFLYAQIECLNAIQERRIKLWNLYNEELKSLIGQIGLPMLPKYATNNAHMYYVVCKDLSERDRLTRYLKNSGIMAVPHYQSLHQSEYYKSIGGHQFDLPNADRFTSCLLRLPLYYELEEEQVVFISSQIKEFYKN